MKEEYKKGDRIIITDKNHPRFGRVLEIYAIRPLALDPFEMSTLEGKFASFFKKAQFRKATELEIVTGKLTG